MTTRPDDENVVLVETLRVAVPLHMLNLSKRTPGELAQIAQTSASAIGSQGDILQFRSSKKGETAKAFNALARGLAAAALVTWGGVTFLGMHWCMVPNCSGPDVEHPNPKGLEGQ